MPDTASTGSFKPVLTSALIIDPRSAYLARNWRTIAFRGVVAIIFGLAAVLLPATALSTLVLIFAAYMLIDGVVAIIAGLRAAAHHERWALFAIEGIVNLAAGVAAMLFPSLTVLVLVTILGVWAVISGVLLIVAAIRLHATHGRWWLAISGLVSLVWGVLLNLAPIAGALVLTWWLGAYALLFGIALLFLAFRLRRAAQT
jgi:uncharacterized membrane protein HdeD (DUF308 family)